MRVLYSFPSQVGSNGIGMTAYHQIKGLCMAGVDVSLYCAICNKKVFGLNKVREFYTPASLKLSIKVLGLRRFAMHHDRLVAKSLVNMKNEIDIVHCWPSASMETLKVAKSMGIKTVLERPSAHTRYVYKVTMQECERLNLHLGKSHYASFNEKKLIHEETEFAMADKLLCPSEFVFKTFKAAGFSDGSLARHQYGYDPQVFFPNGRVRFKNENLKVVFVGDCYPLKGLHFALQAWLGSTASQKGKFYICGKFMPKYREILEKMLGHESVEYMGFVDDVQDIMRECDILVLPSLAEGSALVTYEARACGCVLLVSDSAGAVCEHMENAMVHRAGDVKTLLDHFSQLDLDRRLLAYLKSGNELSVSELTWEKANRKLVEIYEHCLAGVLI